MLSGLKLVSDGYHLVAKKCAMVKQILRMTVGTVPEVPAVLKL